MLDLPLPTTTIVYPAVASLHTVKEPFDFELEYRDSLLKPLGRVEVRFVTIPTLIRMKEAAGRPQDRIDIEYLRKRLQDEAAS